MIRIGRTMATQVPSAITTVLPGTMAGAETTITGTVLTVAIIPMAMVVTADMVTTTADILHTTDRTGSGMDIEILTLLLL